VGQLADPLTGWGMLPCLLGMDAPDIIVVVVVVVVVVTVVVVQVAV